MGQRESWVIRDFIHIKSACMWKIDPARLAAAMARAGLNQSQLADQVGVKQPSVARLLSGETKTSRSLDLIARVLETTPAYIKGEVASPELPDARRSPASINVPQLDLSALQHPVDIAAQRDSHPQIPFPRNWLEPMVADSVCDLFVAIAEGDLMMPTLMDGDLALVDMGQNQLVDQDRLFCLSYGGLVMIRRVRRMADGSLRISADNPIIPPIICPADQCDLVGRVIWIGRQI